MLKDYFDSSISAKNQQFINQALDVVPRYQVFTSYGQARSYRSANTCKREGRYDYSIFLYDGFYYVISNEYRRIVLNTIAYARRCDEFDSYARFSASL